jgi:hypothetical protein
MNIQKLIVLVAYLMVKMGFNGLIDMVTNCYQTLAVVQPKEKQVLNF